MDVQIAKVPTANTTSTATAGKTASTDAASKDAFNQVLGGQLSQESTAGEQSATDPAISLNMLLQMLQSLVLPIQGAVAQPNQGTEDQPLPEMLLEAMNSNPALAEQLLQDPKVGQWFADAKLLLQTLGDGQASGAFPISNGLNLQPADTLNLDAQNTLLALATLTKQQPDNPIVKFLNQDLQNTIQPLLPELMANLKGPAISSKPATPVVEAAEGSVDGNKEELVHVDKASHHKRTSNLVLPQKLDGDSFTLVQQPKSRLELLAAKNVFISSTLESQTDSKESFVDLVDLPTESNLSTNTVVTIADLQKAQIANTAVVKAPATINAGNFAEEMTEHVLKNMKITVAGSFSEAKLSLFPKNLGQVDVRISMHDGQLIAQFAADTLAGKQMLESQLPSLRQALQVQGLQVEKLEVTQNQNMQSSMFQDQRQQQTFGQSQQQNKNRTGNFQEDSLDFNQEVDNIAQVRTAVNGNSFDVIA
ncbi:flagellar hook-length control protein FliK [Paenibacillus sp. HWE-109]|uniref:flagellar hook-length control protein FliK n=1 Tax=Paenibacillus sp. HWE-109 TaxID=1306526 RepID=UPI001EDEBE23|nr:flagellar hook-length control protein FliK [Paenibacillus sp. HWE-109]UKS29885.1 flagellar hook-length control protein FliK [Paenibacillus sp. HWE-109]